MVNCLKDFIKLFDYSRVFLTFKIKEFDTYRSRFGGIVFILFLLFAILLFSFTFLDFYKGKVYSVNYSIAVFKPAPEIKLKDLGFNFAFSIRNDDDSDPDPNILEFFDIKVYDVKLLNSNQSTKNKTEIKAKKCESSDLRSYDTDFEKEFNELNLSKFDCLTLRENNSIQGVYTDPIYNYIDFGIFIKDKYNNSESMLKLKNILGKSPLKLSLYWIDTTIQVRNNTNPISTYIRSYLSYIEYNTITKINLDFSLIQFSSDNNYILNKQNKTNYTSFEETQDFSLFSDNRTSFNDKKLQLTLLKFFFRSSPKNMIIDRKYQKLTEFMAYFGGITSNILVIIFIFVGNMNRFWAQQLVMNKLLKFREHIKFSHPKQFDLLKDNLNGRLNIHKPPIKTVLQCNQSLQDQTCFDNIQNDKNEKLINDDQSKKHIDIETPIDLNFEDKEKSINDHDLTLYKRHSVKEEHNEITMFNNSGKPIKYNSYEIIFRYCPCKTKNFNLKEKLHKKATKKVNNYFDKFTYVNNIQEIDIIKYLLLNKDQVKLFNFISKPSISMSYTNSDNIYINFHKNKLIKSKLKDEEIEEIIESYKVLENKTDNITKKICYLFDYEINHLLVG